MSFQKILIAVDSSSYAIKAAKDGFELAHQIKAKVALVYVIDQGKEMGNVDAGILPEQAAILLKKEAGETIEQFIKLYNGKEEIIHFIPEGSPKEEILNIAQEWEADLIVIGTHGRKGLAHLFAGSIAEDVIHDAKVPVMVIPPNS
jgi:nucleotide-binding universal stress UspA family protein